MNQAVFVAVSLVVGFGESILLPYDVTLRVSLANWAFFGLRYALFTIALALGMAWVVTLQVHATRVLLGGRARTDSRPTARSGPLGALALVVSVLPSLLCCSPIVPTLVSLVGLSATAQLRTSSTIQHFFATKQNLLLIAAVALVVASGLWSTYKLVRARCLEEDCRLPAERTVGDAPALS